MRDNKANQDRWKTKRYGRTETTPGWWWCRLRISPRCEVMNKIDYDNAPRPKGCGPCRVLLDKHNNQQAHHRRLRKKWSRAAWQKEKEARKHRRKCSCCGTRSVWKGRDGNGFRLLCRECFHYGEGRRTSMGEYLIARDFEHAEKRLERIGERLAKTCHIYSRAEIAEYARKNKA